MVQEIIIKTNLREILKSIETAGDKPDGYAQGFKAMNDKIDYYLDLISKDKIKILK